MATKLVSSDGGGIQINAGAGQLVDITDGTIRVNDGTKTIPAVAFNDDTNTGLFSPADEEVAITAAGELVTHYVGVASAVNHLKITNAITLGDVLIEAVGTDANIDVSLNPKGLGSVVIDGLRYPQADGTVNQVIETDGAGNLSFVTPGLSSIIGDTAPQLGGNLDVNGKTITSAVGADILITPDTTGSIVLDGLSWPQADGTINQILETDGAGNLSFVTPSGAAATNWLHANSGGDFTTAPSGTGLNSIALGKNARTSGNADAIAIGSDAGAHNLNNPRAIAIGDLSSALGTDSIAIGSSSNVGAGDFKAIAIGFSSDANVANSIAIGANTNAGGDGDTFGIAIGSSATNDGTRSNGLAAIAIGNDANSAGAGTIAIGKLSGSTTVFNNSVAIGQTVALTAADQLRIGTSNTEHIKYEASKLELVGANAQYVLPSYTVATAPTGAAAGSMAFFTDGNAGGPTGAIHDGTAWKVVSTNATISAT